jgi:hypothetical protein
VRKSRFSEAQIVGILKERGRHPNQGRLPSVRHQRGDFLQVEGQFGGMQVSEM